MYPDRPSLFVARTPSPIRDHDWTINGPLPGSQRIPDEPDTRHPGYQPTVPGSQRRRRRGPMERRIRIPTPAPEVQCWLI